MAIFFLLYRKILIPQNNLLKRCQLIKVTLNKVLVNLPMERKKYNELIMNAPGIKTMIFNLSFTQLNWKSLKNVKIYICGLRSIIWQRGKKFFFVIQSTIVLNCHFGFVLFFLWHCLGNWTFCLIDFEDFGNAWIKNLQDDYFDDLFGHFSETFGLFGKLACNCA